MTLRPPLLALLAAVHSIAAVAAEQPLDYAPRKPGGKGALDEDYGLEKAEREKREAEEKVAAPTGL